MVSHFRLVVRIIDRLMFKVLEKPLPSRPHDPIYGIGIYWPIKTIQKQLWTKSMTDMLFWVVNLSSFENFVWKKNLGSNGLNKRKKGLALRFFFFVLGGRFEEDITKVESTDWYRNPKRDENGSGSEERDIILPEKECVKRA